MELPLLQMMPQLHPKRLMTPRVILGTLLPPISGRMVIPMGVSVVGRCSMMCELLFLSRLLAQVVDTIRRNTWLMLTDALIMQGIQSLFALGLKHRTPWFENPRRPFKLKLAWERTFLILPKLNGKPHLTLAVVPVQRVSPLRLRKWQWLLLKFSVWRYVTWALPYVRYYPTLLLGCMKNRTLTRLNLCTWKTNRWVMTLPWNVPLTRVTLNGSPTCLAPRMPRKPMKTFRVALGWRQTAPVFLVAEFTRAENTRPNRCILA